MSQSPSVLIPKVKTWYVNSTKDILKVLNPKTEVVNLDDTTLVALLKDCIKEIRISEDTIHLKLNKNLIIESDNIAQISSGLNIQIAKQIHLNPDLKGITSHS
jgi:glucose-6-phosphate-specific signal transduction histidine kinase